MLDKIRFQTLGYWEKELTGLGSLYLQKEDPNADNADSCLKEYKEYFILDKTLSKLNADYWSAFLRLCFHCAKEYKSSLEVAANLYLKDDEFILAVPEQIVDFGSVRTVSKGSILDILTGEELDPYFLDYCGSFHSHNTMDLPTFSATDDKYELPLDGFYTLVSNINFKKNTYKVTGSIVINNERRYIDYKKYIDNSKSNKTFHEKVLTQVKQVKVKPFINTIPYKSYNLPNYNTNTNTNCITNYPTVNDYLVIEEFIEKNNIDLSLLEELNFILEQYGLDLYSYIQLKKGEIIL